MVAGFKLLNMVRKISVLLGMREIRVVHLNNEILTHIPLLIAAKLAGCRVLCHLHGWRKMTRSESFLARFVDEFACISKAGSAYFEEQLKRPVMTIRNGLVWQDTVSNRAQLRGRQRELWQIDKDSVVALMAGRLVPWKGQEIFIEALAKAVVTNPDLVGVLMGKDPEPDQRYLRALVEKAASLGLAGKVKFCDWQEDMSPVYEASDIVVHASVTPEPFGLVILEAMMAGKPVIAARGGGVSEMIKDGVTGILTAPGDAAELADALSRVAQDSRLSEQLAEAGRRIAQTEFDMERNAAAVAGIYNSLAGSER